MTFTFSEAIAQPPTFTQTKGIDIVGKTGIEASSTQFNEALTDGSFLVLNSKSYTGTGAGITLDVSKYLHLITISDQTETITVPDGSYVGQHAILIIANESEGVGTGGTTTVSLTSKVGSPPPTINDIGESLTLIWTGVGWAVVAVKGVA